MKKLSFLWAIIFVLFSLLIAGCNPNSSTSPGSGPDDPKIAAVDSVIIQITISVPSCASLHAAEFDIWDNALPNGYMGQYYPGQNVFTYTFTKDEAKNLIGTSCKVSAMLSGNTCNGNGNFILTNGAIIDGLACVKIVLTKGLNKVTLIYSAD